MNIQLNVDQDDAPLPSRKLGPPPDYQSRGFRLRLMTLFAALVLVLILMHEAGKPERWEWMGFDRSAAGEAGPAAASSAGPGSQRKPKTTTTTLPDCWNRVKDNTAVGHVGDAGAWADAWRRVDRATLSDLSDAEEVQRVQLLSQPDAYRGRWVTLRGWVRTARFVDRPIEALGQEAADFSGRAGHYEFWIRPEETNAGPYCVYALHLPAGFPAVTNAFTEMNERVKVTACFFKNRSYVAADEAASVAPLLLAASFTRLATPTDPLAVSTGKWMPGVPAMIGIAIAFALLAAGLAWWAKRTAQTPRYQHGDHMTGQIHDGLDRLVLDPNVMTDREKVIAFQGHMESDPDSEPRNG